MRALVDGEVAEPSDVVFKSGTVEFNGVRSFTFVKPTVQAGPTFKEDLSLVQGSAVCPGDPRFIRRRAFARDAADPLRILRPSVPAVYLEALSCANHIPDQVIVPSATLH